MSSDRPKRAFRLDYRIYSETGKKVAKEKREFERLTENFRNLAMAGEKIGDEEKQLSFKITRFFDEYELDTLFDIGDIELGITELKKLIESYEEIHIELKRELDNEYENTYTDFEDKVKLMTTWVKNAKLEIKKKKEEKRRRENEEKGEKLRKEKEEKEEKLRKEKEENARKEKEEMELRKAGPN